MGLHYSDLHRWRARYSFNREDGLNNDLIVMGFLPIVEMILIDVMTLPIERSWMKSFVD